MEINLILPSNVWQQIVKKLMIQWKFYHHANYDKSSRLAQPKLIEKFKVLFRLNQNVCTHDMMRLNSMIKFYDNLPELLVGWWTAQSTSVESPREGQRRLTSRHNHLRTLLLKYLKSDWKSFEYEVKKTFARVANSTSNFTDQVT